MECCYDLRGVTGEGVSGHGRGRTEGRTDQWKCEITALLSHYIIITSEITEILFFFCMLSKLKVFITTNITIFL